MPVLHFDALKCCCMRLLSVTVVKTRATVARPVTWHLQAESDICLYAQLTFVVFPLESWNSEHPCISNWLAVLSLHTHTYWPILTSTKILRVTPTRATGYTLRVNVNLKLPNDKTCYYKLIYLRRLIEVLCRVSDSCLVHISIRSNVTRANRKENDLIWWHKPRASIFSKYSLTEDLTTSRSSVSYVWHTALTVMLMLHLQEQNMYFWWRRQYIHRFLYYILIEIANMMLNWI